MSASTRMSHTTARILLKVALVRDAPAKSGGYLVDTAFDGQDAFEKLAQTPTHVLVTDLMMPRMDSFELLKRLDGKRTVRP